MTQLAEVPSASARREFVSLLDAVRFWAEATPEALAADTSDHGRLSYAALKADAESLARAFVALGLKAGDRVAIQLPSMPEFLTTYIACTITGCVLTTLHMPYRKEELRPLLRFAGPRADVPALDTTLDEQLVAAMEGVVRDERGLRFEREESD